MPTPPSNDEDALTRLRREIANNFGFPELVPPLVETSRDSFSGRVNLVIHSLQEKWTFGGIATARRLFEQLAKRFERARIIVLWETQSSFEPSHWPGWVLEGEGGAQRTVKFLGDRKTPLSITADDYFVATAWLT